MGFEHFGDELKAHRARKSGILLENALAEVQVVQQSEFSFLGLLFSHAAKRSELVSWSEVRFEALILSMQRFKNDELKTYYNWISFPACLHGSFSGI